MYKSAQFQGSSTYNYSQNPDVQQLTQLFLGLATTLDYGRKLAWTYRFDKLGLDQPLRELEELQAAHQVEELSAIEPILRKIADDPNLMHISRQSAQHLLKSLLGASGTESEAATLAHDRRTRGDSRRQPLLHGIYNFRRRFSATSYPTGVLIDISREGLDEARAETRRSHLSGSRTREYQVCQGHGVCDSQQSAVATDCSVSGRSAESHVRIVRLSYLDGQVQMAHADQGLDRAILNTPIVAGHANCHRK